MSGNQVITTVESTIKTSPDTSVCLITYTFHSPVSPSHLNTHLPFLKPLFTIVFLNSCHPFTLHTPYILPRHKVRSQMLLVSFSFSWGRRIALPQGWFDKDDLHLFLLQHLQWVGNTYLLHAGLKTLTTATWGQATSGKLFSWHGNSSSSWQCDKGKKKNQSKSLILTVAILNTGFLLIYTFWCLKQQCRCRRLHSDYSKHATHAPWTNHPWRTYTRNISTALTSLLNLLRNSYLHT